MRMMRIRVTKKSEKMLANNKRRLKSMAMTSFGSDGVYFYNDEMMMLEGYLDFAAVMSYASGNPKDFKKIVSFKRWLLRVRRVEDNGGMSHQQECKNLLESLDSMWPELKEDQQRARDRRVAQALMQSE